MNKDQFISFFDNPFLIDNESAKEMQQLIDQYPYFQSARLLFLKSLYDNKSISYQTELKLTAAYAGNRAILQALILRKADDNLKEAVTEVRKPITEEKEQSAIPLYQEEKVTSSSHIEIEFDFVEANEQQQAFELPKLTEVPQEALSEKKKQQLEIIDRFIKAEPRIIPKEINKDQVPDLSADSAVETEFLTETLAEIYVRQKKYDKAIVMFQKLSLKLPQKSVYFASRISDINTIVNQDKN
jgi:predicted Zn-dependent protease